MVREDDPFVPPSLYALRRLLLVAGGLGMALFTGAFAVATSRLFDYQDPANKGLAAAIIVFTALYVLNFAYSWGPLG
jgi:hypothetical protein